MTDARVTPGPWEFAYIDGEYAGIWSPSGRADGTPDIYCYPDGPPNAPTPHERLILVSANACFSLNPTDPLAAAQHLEELVQWSQIVLDWYMDQRTPGQGMPKMRGLEAALSRVTGKS